MPRIQISTDDLRLQRLEEIGEQLTKGDPEASMPAKRSAAFDYLVDAIVNANHTVNAQKADISRLQGLVKEGEKSESIQAKLDALTEDHEKTQYKLNGCRSDCHRLERGTTGMMETISFLVERLRGFEL